MDKRNYYDKGPRIYTIIGGVNGCGKSSLTGILKTERLDLGAVIDADKLSAQYGSAIGGGKAAVRKIDECLRLGVNFTQETTLSGSRTEHTARRAKELGYVIRLYYVGLDTLEESLRRIANRVAKGGHDIPLPDVARRFATRFEDVAKILPYCDEACFFDNNNGFIEVAGYQNGELLPRGSSAPLWIQELSQYLEVVFP